jgi:Ca2+-binding RTX toxin-like protein
MAEFRLNNTTDGLQSEPSVTALSDGRFVASWSSFEPSSGTIDIRGRLFNGDGSPVGNDFVINSITDAHDHVSSVIGLADGGFVATWDHQLGGSDEIHGQVFNASGVPVGDEFAVSADSGGADQLPTMTALPDGRFVVTWYGQGVTDTTYDITARIFNADGSPAGDEFTINTRSGSYEYEPSVTTLSDGRFVFTWHFSDYGAIQRARIFNADGTPAGDEFGFADESAGAQDYRSHVTPLNGGGFVVVWDRHVSGLNDGQGDIRARFFKPDGTPAGEDILVNTETVGDQTNATATSLSDGRVMVHWLDHSEGGTYAIRGRLFNADGSAVGDDLTVDTGINAVFAAPRVDALSDGRFVVAWQELDGETGTYDIHGTILQAEPDNEPPVAMDDNGMHVAFNMPAVFTTADLLANDTDAEHDPLTIVSVSGAAHGSVALDADGNPVFTSAGNFSGAASFDYTVSDGHGTSTATVHFTVDGPAQILGGGPGDDFLAGADGNDRVTGNGGADVLVGGNGNDWLIGGKGHDVLFGGHGGDTMLGGVGDDIYYVDNASDLVADGKNGGVDEVRSSISLTLGSYIENLVLNGAVNGTGNKLDNHITGSDQANTLSGMIGRDVLEGAGGDDTLIGGRDSDTFVFRPGFGHDTITDFAVAGSYSAIGPTHDVLVFGSSVFADAAAMFAHSADTAQGMLITADAGDSVLLKGVTVAQLQAHPEDFQFV